MTVDPVARQQFLSDYRYIRYAEGRGSDESSYYRELPFKDVVGKMPAMWAMRAATYRFFEKKVLQPLERVTEKPLDILDLGAGNCWTSYRVCLRNHRPVAVDIFDDDRDGLLASRHYPRRFPVVDADFDDLPFPSRSFDIALFNASLHYSTDYVRTLSEARRCLRDAGTLVILDSPVYRRREHGLLMVEERHRDFHARYGLRSDALPSIEFLDVPTLRGLEKTLGLKWQILRPWYGWRWHLRPLRAAFLRRRPPSKFWVLIGRFQNQ
jgi:SAM-dependent methyltransferase